MQRILTTILAVMLLAAPLAMGADKGSQLIFQPNMAHKNFIAISNSSSDNAVTVLTQYYNDKMELVLFYLRVLPAGANVMVDPFDHVIPGSAMKDDDDKEIPDSATNVSDVLAEADVNSGRFVISVTAVGANNDGKDEILEAGESPTEGVVTTVGGYRIAGDEIVLIAKDTTPVDGGPDTVAYRTLSNATDPQYKAGVNRAATANILFPDFLASGMHGTDNIDNGGSLSLTGKGLIFDKFTGEGKDDTAKNVGDLSVTNAIPVAFNHLTGHFTEALVGSASGGSDQTASWGGRPITRPAVSNTMNTMVKYSNNVAGELRMEYMVNDYHLLTGMDTSVVVDHGPDDSGRGWISLKDHNDIDGVTELTDATAPEGADETDFDNEAVRGIAGGRLAEKSASGMGGSAHSSDVSGYTGDNAKHNGARSNRGVNGGGLVLPALHGGGDETKQIMLLLSVADGGFGAGGYKLMAAKTKYMVNLSDNMGDSLSDPADDRVFGGAGAADLAGTGIIVDGIQVYTDAGDCGGNMLASYWTVADLVADIPQAASGSGKFAGLDAMLDPLKNTTPGSIMFNRGTLTCKKEYGDGDASDGDGIPARDYRTYKAGTLIVEMGSSDRTFVTTGQALIKFLTPNSSYAASWPLGSN